jgi:hypothetical protein
MKPIDKFKKSCKVVKNSKLSEFNDDILKLLDNGYMTKQIHEYLTVHREISVDLSYLYKYIKKLQVKG